MSVLKKPAIKAFLPLLLIFIFVSSFSVIFSDTFRRLHIDQSLFLTGNIILFVVTILTFLLYNKALHAGNTHAFLRNVFTGMGLKFFICLIASFMYIYNAGNAVNKPGLFGLMFLYFLYTFIEVAILMKLSRQIRQNKNG